MVCTFLLKKQFVRNTLYSISGDEQDQLKELIQLNNVDGCSKSH